MSRQYRDWEDRNHGPEDEASGPADDPADQDREELDARTNEAYIPTQEDQELMRQDMMDPALFGDLAYPVDPPGDDPDIPF